MIRYFKTILCVVLVQIFNSCDSGSNCNDLGSNLFLLEGDRKEDRIVVYCTGDNAGACSSGLYVIPNSYESHMVDGRYSEYVERVGFNDQWVIAESRLIKTNVKRYWFLNKSSVNLIKTKGSTIEDVSVDYLRGPYNYEGFLNLEKSLSINDLTWCN